MGSHGRRGLYSLGNARQMWKNSNGLGSFISLLRIIPVWTSISTAICILQPDLQVVFGMGGAPVVTGNILRTEGTLHRRNLHVPPAWCSHFSSHCHHVPAPAVPKGSACLHRARMGFSIFQLFGNSRKMVLHLLFALQMFLTGISRLS